MKKETYEKPTIKTEKIKLGVYGDDYGNDCNGPNINGGGSPLGGICDCP
jgi:hypothetical protein